MSISMRLAAVAVKPLASGASKALGTTAVGGAIEAVGGYLVKRFTDHSQRLGLAIRQSHERAWRAMEIALAGNSWWDRAKTKLASTEDLAFRAQVQAFLTQAAPDDGVREDFRIKCLEELRQARKRGLLDYKDGEFDGIADAAAGLVRFDDPLRLLDAERTMVGGIAEELRAAGCPNLANWIVPPKGPPLVAVAARYFFRRAIEEDAKLFQALAFGQLERLQEGQEEGFAALNDALAEQGQRLETLLGDLQTVVVETRDAVLDMRAEQERQGQQFANLYQAIIAMQQKLDLSRREIRPKDSLSIRTDDERRLVKQLVAKYRALPEESRQEMPAMLNAVGQLQVAAGDFQGAQQDFAQVAEMVTDTSAKATAHINAYRAALEKRDFGVAIRELVEAIKLDPKRHMPFPVTKYQPSKILGAGGFGVAFLCKHKYLNAPVVVKTLLGDELDRNVDDLFTEAQALRQIDHPAIIRLQDCGYVEPAARSRPFMVMDYFEGKTLEQYVTENGPLSTDDLLALVKPVAAGLQAAHVKGILHRDVKPANLLVRKDKGGWQVKLIDFGLAMRSQALRDTNRRSKTLAGASIAGTIDYAAPEQMGKIDAKVGPASDVYGFGKTCCFALFHTTQPLLSHWKSIPQPLAELLERTLNEDPSERPVSFDVVSRCFARLGSSDSAVTKSVPTSGSAVTRDSGRGSRVQREPEPARRRDEPEYPEPKKGLPAGLIAGGIVAVVLLIGAGVVFALTRGGKSRGTPTLAENTNPAFMPSRPTFPTPPIDTGSRPNPPPRTPRTPQVGNEAKVVVDGVPNEKVVEYVVERLKHGPADRRHGERDGSTTVQRRSGVGAKELELRLGGVKEPLEWVRGCDLDAVDDGDGGFKATLIAPPATLAPVNPKLNTGLKLNKASATVLLNAILRGDTFKRGDALKELGAFDVDNANRDVVRAALRSVAVAGDAFHSGTALKLLGRWATVEDVPFMIALAQKGGHGTGEAVAEALGDLGSDAGTDYLVRNLDAFVVDAKAMEALRRIGQPAEKALVGGLGSSNDRIRQRCCELLKDHGSTGCIDALKLAVRDKNREVSKGAWDAWKSVAFRNAAPPAKPTQVDPPPQQALKPPVTIDDLTVTTLAEKVTLLPFCEVSADGQTVLTLDASGNVRRVSWEGKIEKSVSLGKPTVAMALSSDGVMVLGVNEAWLLDVVTLEERNKGPLDNFKAVTAAGSVAAFRSDARGVIVLSDGSLNAQAQYTDKQLVLASGRSDPVLSPNGRFLFARGGGKLNRFRLDTFKLLFAEMSPTSVPPDGGRIVVSPDSKYVALLHADGNRAEAGEGATAVYPVEALKKPAFVVAHGPNAKAMAFGPKGEIYVAAGEQTLIRYSASGTKLREYKFDGAGPVKQIVVATDGTRLAVLTESKLFGVELPK